MVRIEIEGKDVGSGAFADGLVIGYEPDYIDESRTGNHWTKIYKDVPADSIIIEYGHSRGGVPFRSVRTADGSSVPKEVMRVVKNLPLWKEHER